MEFKNIAKSSDDTRTIEISEFLSNFSDLLLT